jgi:hypothetical protein
MFDWVALTIIGLRVALRITRKSRHSREIRKQAVMYGYSDSVTVNQQEPIRQTACVVSDVGV